LEFLRMVRETFIWEPAGARMEKPIGFPRLTVYAHSRPLTTRLD
jgi:hypothetical protein